MAKEAKIPIPQFQLRAIELHEIAIHKIAPGFAINNFSFEINIETNIDRNKSIVISSTWVRICAEDKVTELGRVNCACIFSVGNFDEVITMKGEDSFELSESFADTIHSISISTTRGMMASELKGTVLHHAFLPIIDVKSLAKASIQ
jgi:hypothetical protein